MSPNEVFQPANNTEKAKNKANSSNLQQLSTLNTLLIKFVSAIYFLPNDSPSKTEKCFLFHLKSTCRSRDIQIFCVFVFPPFSLSAIALKFMMSSTV